MACDTDDARDLIGCHAGELPLQEAVVVARAAGPVPGSERRADLTLVVEEAARPDLVCDRMAVALDHGIRGG